jgi:hypothetical protein
MKGKSEKKEKEWATSYYLSLFNANKPKKYSYLCSYISNKDKLT